MTQHGLSQADFNEIMTLDPFSNGPAAIDSGRFARTVQSFPYKPPDTSQECNGAGTCSCLVMSNKQILNNLVTSTTSTKTSYSVGLKESVGGGLSTLVSASVSATQRFTWTATSSQSNLKSSTKSAIVTIPCPSTAWIQPEDYTLIDVYWDTWYGSFMFAPTVVAEHAVGTQTFATGHVVNSARQPLRHEPVDVVVGGTTYHTVTDSAGDFAYYGIEVQNHHRGAAARQAVARVRKQTFNLALGSESQKTITIRH